MKAGLRLSALHSTLIPGQELAYVEAHRRVPRDLLTSLTSAGVRDWAIWRHDGELFHLIDTDDYAAVAAALADDPANERWQQQMLTFVDGWVELDEVPAFADLSLVWSLHAQRAEDPDIE
jgi:L-rhamnose mutarotase